jgi:hypothetical protein
MSSRTGHVHPTFGASTRRSNTLTGSVAAILRIPLPVTPQYAVPQLLKYYYYYYSTLLVHCLLLSVYLSNNK